MPEPRATTDQQIADPLDETPSTAETCLDANAAVVLRLLPRFRALGPADLNMLAVNLRRLSNVAEAWAQRTDKPPACEDE